ncbi:MULTISPECIES: SGNH/GDSL hydrolase family protein [Klebsiella pneumoniae complex]|uniref:SGNH/GDSL hydrolase family protein n=1 Tax=Klebsiella pneumoniae complex TaxID=3390273 RepID=UPI0007CC8213|nr:MULTISPECIES: SGNH/GDSL hydrolase family protein [Klebsiella]MBZ7559680.1 SGNH/GDSL hydrolase family protein [Klebsiella variicola]SBJ62344.1 putative prophage endo-N-neuraminidase [Klebsiella pneumoniae]HBX9977436.1 SGNH/GDSL hydrolase family protein [Klebsiella variicola]HBY9507823.1 SGNH/GDSL hydrolase family protein [Klebsiella pneumoniae]
MTDISEESKWVETVPLITRGDKVSGGLNGVANKQALAIASRTRWLKDQIDGIQSGEMPYSSEVQAQEAINSGRLKEGYLIAIRSSGSKNWVDEYRVVSGGLQKTGKSLPALEYIESITKNMVVGSVSGWEGNTLYPFDEFLSPNENTLSLHAYAVNSIKYREACGSLQIPVATGDIITVRYKYSGKGGAPSVGLKTSINGTFVSNQVTLTASDNWQEIQLTATAATATLMAVGVNTRLATDIQLSIIAYSNKKNAITAAILAAMDGQASLTGKTKIGTVNTWVNNSGYPFSVLSQANDNRVNYVNSTGVYSEMYAGISVPSGGAVTLNYSLDVTAGRLFARLANGSEWTGDEVQLAGGGARQTITLVAAADTKQLKIYSRAEISAGSFFAEVNYGQKNALTEQIDSLYSAVASANAVLAVLSQSSTFDSFVKSSPYTYTLSDAGVAYKQMLSTVNAVTGVSTVKMMYKISSTSAALKIQSRNGSAWGANETLLIADGDYHEVDLPVATGQVFSGWGVYSSAKAGGYSADITMIPVSANGTFFTPATAILYSLMSSAAGIETRVTNLESGVVTNQNTDVVFPSYFYAVEGRPLRFYGANLVSGERPWHNGADVVLSSHGYEGKPILLKSIVPDATILPSEINGPTLVVNARADKSGAVYRKKAAFTRLPAAQAGNVKVACIMDSLGERCVPWLYFALNATGATYLGVGSRKTRGMTDDGGYTLPNTPGDGIPFDGRGGWTTFDYIGKTQKTNFSQPFLRDAVAADFAAYPQYCYDKAYSGQSYADNPNLGGYHIFDVTAWMAAAGVSTGDKLVVVIQLGYNDLYYSFTPQQTVDAQEFMIAKFREKIANSRFVISHQAFGWSGISAPKNWPDFAKWITQKIRQFDNRLNEKIIVAPAWAQLSYKYGMSETITATSDTGVQTVSLPDDVHPGELGGAQWGDALLAPVLAAWGL